MRAASLKTTPACNKSVVWLIADARTSRFDVPFASAVGVKVFAIQSSPQERFISPTTPGTAAAGNRTPRRYGDGAGLCRFVAPRQLSRAQLPRASLSHALYGRANWAKRRARESATMLMFWQIEALHFGDYSGTAEARPSSEYLVTLLPGRNQRGIRPKRWLPSGRDRIRKTGILRGNAAAKGRPRSLHD